MFELERDSLFLAAAQNQGRHPDASVGLGGSGAWKIRVCVASVLQQSALCAALGFEGLDGRSWTVPVDALGSSGTPFSLT